MPTFQSSQMPEYYLTLQNTKLFIPRPGKVNCNLNNYQEIHKRLHGDDLFESSLLFVYPRFSI